jgi:hypothetical protein
MVVKLKISTRRMRAERIRRLRRKVGLARLESIR